MQTVSSLADRQFFRSQIGLPAPYATLRQTPLTHSFCQHVVAAEDTLLVRDARADPRVCDNLAVRDLNMIAYLEVPLRMPDGSVLGSLCAIDAEEREIDEITLRLDIAKHRELQRSEMRERELHRGMQASLANVETLVEMSVNMATNLKTFRDAMARWRRLPMNSTMQMPFRNLVSRKASN